ncbi:coenzyme F420-dependent N5,N10-methylene tetrahydromethanopterin reductase [Longilinea arvoryzae]|uniref:Coenzyme F420-dependent N5,N10-methylene tetrahydromethanopterin reductase n=1 Tax=Longilinea arvoryzae TaxID=360412 RepID=A0A0S7B6E2_9CHLR|nr:LLM class flavin-dependent oxidoreductase [Longilinea arvoryzae]GAP12462.1 coenzyme F420-dependent N5,N10-methylene tetrahydromethanopterin reductase [Longilinea arvoryzae]
MNFGVALPYLSAREIAELAYLAEEHGWDGAFVGDAIWTVDPIVSLSAAAMRTQRIRLGVMVVPVPLRKPWKIASESAALDHLSGGRLTLALATGAVWMGWQAFPDAVTDTRLRAEMLDETIDILTQLYAGQPFDYDGRHYHLKLTALDPQYYPPRPVQQPRIPLWVVGAWPRPKSMRRALKCDGVLPVKSGANGQFAALTPAEVAEVKAYIEANRAAQTPFDIVIEGSTAGLDAVERQARLAALRDAGATWWIEGLWGATFEEAAEHIRKGAPTI